MNSALGGTETNGSKTLISVLELRRLLFDIKDRKQEVCFRYRMLGEMWARSFCQIVHLSEKGVLLQEEGTHHLKVINDLNNVVQFELDQRFMGFQPYYHYDVSSMLGPDASL